MSAAAGKVPKGKMPLVEALAGQLAVTESIELSEGDQKIKVDGFALAARIFESIPAPVVPGRLSLSDPEETGKPAVTPRDLLKTF
jgi:hypothetical protein